jgi:hypothetical protein
VIVNLDLPAGGAGHDVEHFGFERLTFDLAGFGQGLNVGGHGGDDSGIWW